MTSRQSETERQYNDQKKNDDLQSIKLKIVQHERHYKPGVNSNSPEDLAVSAPHMTPAVLLLNDTNIIWYETEETDSVIFHLSQVETNCIFYVYRYFTELSLLSYLICNNFS